jgi:hypothetical protein
MTGPREPAAAQRVPAAKTMSTRRDPKPRVGAPANHLNLNSNIAGWRARGVQPAGRRPLVVVGMLNGADLGRSGRPSATRDADRKYSPSNFRPRSFRAPPAESVRHRCGSAAGPKLS